MNTIKQFLFLALFFFATTVSWAQSMYTYHEKGYGLGVIYNLPIGEFGFQGHMNYHINDFWIISGQVEYFPGFSEIQELNAGINARYIVNPHHNWGLYPTAGYHFNWWMNADSSPNPDAKPYNHYLDLGAGIQKNYGCLRPFAEYRVNVKWWESNVRAGITWYPFSCGNVDNCPTYVLPQH